MEDCSYVMLIFSRCWKVHINILLTAFFYIKTTTALSELEGCIWLINYDCSIIRIKPLPVKKTKKCDNLSSLIICKRFCKWMSNIFSCFWFMFTLNMFLHHCNNFISFLMTWKANALLIEKRYWYIFFPTNTSKIETF